MNNFSLVEITRLDEVRGRIKDLDKILDSFRYSLDKRLKSRPEYPEKILLKTEDLKPVQSFSNSITVELFFKKGYYTKATGEFVTDDLQLDSNGKLHAIHIKLGVVWDLEDSLEDLLDKITSDFSHEITHAYEEYERLSRRAPSLGAKDFIEHYEKIREESYSIPEYIVKSILYFTSKVEQKAFLGEIYSESKRLAKIYRSAQELYDHVLGKTRFAGGKVKNLVDPETQVGKSYRVCEELMQIWNGKEPYQGKPLWKFANETTPGWQEELIRVWNDIFGTNVETIGDVSIKLNRIWDKYVPSFNNKVGKIVYDVWEEKSKA